MEANLFYVVSGMLLVTSLLILVVLVIILQIVRLIVLPPVQAVAAAARESFWVTLSKRFVTGDIRPIGQEQTIMLDHNYDGIQELDHRMPPWLAYFFYGTIAFAIIYMVGFWGVEAIPTGEQEYVTEVETAEQQIAEYKKRASAGIDETNVQLATAQGAIEAGKSLFAQNCQACHGGAGEGGVGPNLTDEYWLHGGTVKDVFKTIKYGVPQKGMIAWQQKLKPDEIQNVSSYILSLQGTNPPNAKAPEGDRIAAHAQAGNQLSMK